MVILVCIVLLFVGIRPEFRNIVTLDGILKEYALAGYHSQWD